MIVRAEKNKRYTTISNYALEDINLSLKAKGLWALIMTKPDAWNVTAKGMSSVLPEGIDAITTALKELEKNGYLVRGKTRSNNGRFKKGENILYERPQTTMTGKSSSGKARLILNTNKVNTDKTLSKDKEELTLLKNPEQVSSPSLQEIELIELNDISSDVDILTTKSIKPSYGNPEITELIDKFESVFDTKLRRVKQQRFAAKRLIQTYTLQKALGSIEAAFNVRDEQYAPQILSLEDLWTKWDKLVAYCRKNTRPNVIKVEE